MSIRTVQIVKRGRQGVAGPPGFVTTVDKATSFLAIEAEKNYAYLCTGALTVTFQSAASLGNGWTCFVEARGGIVTLNPTENINGQADFTLPQGTAGMIFTDGVEFFCYFMQNAPGGTPWGDLAFKDESEISAKALQESLVTEWTLSGSSPNVLTLPNAVDALAWDVILEGVYCNTYSPDGMRVVVKIGTHDNYTFGYVSGNGVVLDRISQPGLTFGWSRNVVLPARSEGNIAMRIARNGSAAEFVGGVQAFSTGDVVTSDTGLGRGYVAASGGAFNDTITLYAERGDPYAAAAIAGKVYAIPIFR